MQARHSLLAVAVAAAALAAPAAHAQSTVTLFGVVDANVRHVKNGGDTTTSLSNNGLNSSRFGVRGSKDLALLEKLAPDDEVALRVVRLSKSRVFAAEVVLKAR